MTDILLSYTDLVPVWLDYLLRGLILCGLLCFTCVILSRAGRNPYWALLMIVPYFYVPMFLIVVFAFIRWPHIDRAEIDV